MDLRRRCVLLIILASSFSVFLMVSCEESLPPRQDPKMVFRPVLRSEYVHAWNENGLRFSLDLINTYDETIEDTAVFQGTIRIEMPRRPEMGRTLIVRRDSLSAIRYYNPVTKQFTVNPGDTIRFTIRWDMANDVGTSLPDSTFLYYKDLTCQGRWLAYEEVFLVSARLTISRRLGEASFSQVPVTLCYKFPFVGSKDCPKAPETCDRRTTWPVTKQ